MRYYISDLHFFHYNLCNRMDKRGFKSVEDMNKFMIKQWNSRVNKNDEVVILGDFSMGSAQQTEEILKELNGKKFLIAGNHDKFLKDKSFNRNHFQWIRKYEELNDNNRKVILCHCPCFCYPGQFRLDENKNPKVYMLFGHVHNTLDLKLTDEFQEITRNSLRTQQDGSVITVPCNMINCFSVFSNYIPLTLDEWIELEEERLKNPKYEEKWIYHKYA